MEFMDRTRDLWDLSWCGILNPKSLLHGPNLDIYIYIHTLILMHIHVHHSQQEQQQQQQQQQEQEEEEEQVSHSGSWWTSTSLQYFPVQLA